MEKEKNVFLTEDIIIEEWDYDNPDRYVYARQKLNPKDYGKEEMSKDEFKKWAEDNLSHEEIYETPAMNALRYFPGFVNFDDEDYCKISSNTCLIYDTEFRAYAVGMTGGGMDLSPHLLDTFIELENGVPIELAEEIRLDYNAYIGKEKHKKNCALLAKAYQAKAKTFMFKAKQLKA